MLSSCSDSDPAMISDFSPSFLDLSCLDRGPALVPMIGFDTVRDGRNSKEVVMGDAKDPQWRWPTLEKWFSRLDGTWKTRDTSDVEGENRQRQDGLKCPFRVTIRISEAEDAQDNVTVSLRSPYLIAILGKCFVGHVQSLCCEEPEIDAKDLFIAWAKLQEEYDAIAHRTPSLSINGLRPDDGVQDELRNGGISAAAAAAETEEKPVEDDDPKHDGPHSSNVEFEDDISAAMHLHHLLRFLRHHFKDVSAKLSWMTEKGVVSYDMLWAFLTPGVTVRWTCNISGQDCFGIVKSRGTYTKNPFRPDKNGFVIKLEVKNHNAKSYRTCIQKYKMPEFDGEAPFTSLAVCPLFFFDTCEKQRLEERLMERGGKFYQCAMREPFRFMQFKGSMGYYERSMDGCFQLNRVNADGRVMVDLLSTARANPDWPLGNAQPPSELLRGDGAKTAVDDDEESGEDPAAKRPTDEELKWAPAIVFGFSFSLKKWGCFDLDGLKEIRFNDEAYEQLVMRRGLQKEMLRSIVSTRLVSGNSGGGRKANKSSSVDVVAHKGEGCVILCYGPPGTGKTLTAETLAETLHRPLWAISAFELGEEAGHLEKNLRQVLSTAYRWRAVVLLDEADCYLERRSYDVDIKHNLMTGVFLRLLEYYGGVLFLTTNRVRAFDSAFLSRISLCLHYPPLDDGQRRKVWRTLLERAGAAGSGPAGIVSDADVEGFLRCGRPLNGREIRNVVVLAVSWASSLSKPLHISHVHDALQFVVAGAQELSEDLREP